MLGDDPEDTPVATVGNRCAASFTRPAAGRLQDRRAGRRRAEREQRTHRRVEQVLAQGLCASALS
jgi:hypothetical protein